MIYSASVAEENEQTPVYTEIEKLNA